MAFAFKVDISDETGTVGQATLDNLLADADAALSDWSRYVSGAGTLVARIDITAIPSVTGQSYATADGGATTYTPTGSLDGRTLLTPSSLTELQTGAHAAGTDSDITVSIDAGYLTNILYTYPDPADPGATVPRDRIDAVSTLLHEFGHGLGILAFTGQDGSLGTEETLFDHDIRKNPDGTADFIGANAEQVYGGPVPLTTSYAPENYSHLANGASDPLASDIMNGVVFYEGEKYGVSDVDLAILKDVGANVTAWVEGASEPARNDTAPLVSGLPAASAVAGLAAPFANVTIADPDLGQVETVTVAVSNTRGVLSNLGTGSYDAATRTYSVAGTAGAVTQALRSLVFTPAAAGGTTATTFTLTAGDGYRATTATTVVTSDAPPPNVAAAAPTGGTNGADGAAGGAALPVTVAAARGAGANDLVVQGAHAGYAVALDPASGSAVVQDGTAGRDGTQTRAGLHDILFTDGIGRFDATGNAEAAARLYQAALGRAPDPAGLDAWAGALDAGTLSLDQEAAQFIASPEFAARYGAPDDAGFVQLLYRNVLGRAGDAAGAQAWAGQLDAGTLSRAQVLADFSGSAENKADTAATIGDKDRGEAYRLYQAAFDRAPDSAGLNDWTSSLDGGATPLQVAQQFVASAEFAQAYAGLDSTGYVQLLYRNVLHRAGDAAGVQAWAGQLDSRTQSRAQVLLGFSDGLENRLNTAAATHDGWVFIAGA